MCFSPKMKAPKVDTAQVVPPAPLTEQPTGVVFGGNDEDNSADTTANATGRKSVTVKKDPAKATSATKSITNKAFNQ